MRPRPLPGPQPARPARETDRGRCPRSSATRASGAAAGSGSSAGRRTPAARRSRRRRSSSTSCGRLTGPAGAGGERDRPAHRPGRRAPRRQRGRAAGGVRVGRVPDVAGVRSVLTGLRPGMTERECAQLLEVERLAPLLPPHAHRRAAGEVRAAEPRRPADRARRPVHDRVRDLGRAQLPGGVRRRGCVGAARRHRGLRRASRRAVLRGGGRVVRRRCTSARSGGELQAIVDRHLGDSFFGVSLNPGHQLHLDEWVNSPVFPGSTIELRSGMALQCDIIPATGTPYFTTNIEDGVALADESLRAAFAAAVSGRVGTRPGPPALHDRHARHRPASGRASVLEPRRPPPAVPAARPTRR